MNYYTLMDWARERLLEVLPDWLDAIVAVFPDWALFIAAPVMIIVVIGLGLNWTVGIVEGYRKTADIFRGRARRRASDEVRAENVEPPSDSLWERDPINELPAYYREIFPDIRPLFETVVLHFLCLQRTETEHLNRLHGARKRLQRYGLVTVVIGTLTGTAHSFASQMPFDSIPYLRRYTVLIGFIMAGVGIAQNMEPYLKVPENVSGKISNQLNRLNELKSDIVQYDPRRDQDDFRLRELQRMCQAIRTDSSEIARFKLLPFRELTAREKQSALDYKLAWYLRVKKRDAPPHVLSPA